MTTSAGRLRSWAAQHGLHAESTIERALAVAERAHAGEFRRSGDPYITHPVAVAEVLANCGADLPTIVVAILHDLLDTFAVLPEAELRAEFGDEIFALLHEFTELERSGRFDEHSSRDVRAVRVKIADRLHNMRTIEFVDRSAQEVKAGQTLQVVAPMARRIGLADVGNELEALATSTLRSVQYASCAAADPPGRPRPENAVISTCRGLLAVGVVILPKRCRQRWLREWDGELHALPDRMTRLRFAAEVLFGLPYLAIVTRRTGGS